MLILKLWGNKITAFVFGFQSSLLSLFKRLNVIDLPPSPLMDQTGVIKSQILSFWLLSPLLLLLGL